MKPKHTRSAKILTPWTSKLLISLELHIKATETELLKHLQAAGWGYLHVIDLAGLHVASVLFSKVVFTLCLSLCTCPDLFIIQRDKKRRDSALNTTSSHNLRRGRTHSPPPLWDTTCFRWEDSIATLWNNPIHTSPSASPRPLLSCCWPQCPRCRCRRWNSYLQPGEPFYPEAEHWEQRRQQIRGTATSYQHETAR